MNIDTLGLSENSVKRGERLVASGRVKRDEEYPTIWWVTSERADQTDPYRVQADVDESGNFSWVTCTCQHGLRSGGGRATCYHVAAALLLAEAERAKSALDEADEAEHLDSTDDVYSEERIESMREHGEHPLGFDTMKEVRGDA
jgi:hypothetical protein